MFRLYRKEAAATTVAAVAVVAAATIIARCQTFPPLLFWVFQQKKGPAKKRKDEGKIIS